MDRHIDGKSSVREIVVRFPQARGVLEALGIDFCCGGKHSLAEAAEEAAVELPQVLEALSAALANPASAAPAASRDWAEAALAELADHIVGTHHAFMKRELPRLESLFGKVRKAHAGRHGPMLEKLYGVFTDLRAELEPHLMKEERILFPGIQRLEAQIRAGEPVTPMPCGSIRNPIGQMEHEHGNAGVALARMREISGDYALPDDACPTFTALYDLLRTMEADLHEHIHLENNILFPRAVALEMASQVPAAAQGTQATRGGGS